MTAARHCPRCDGLGRLTAHSVPCSACGGSGEAKDARRLQRPTGYNSGLTDDILDYLKER